MDPDKYLEMQSDIDLLWFEKRVEYISRALKEEYSINDILVDYANSATRWADYDRALNQIYHYDNNKELKKFMKEAVRFQFLRLRNLTIIIKTQKDQIINKLANCSDEELADIAFFIWVEQQERLQTDKKAVIESTTDLHLTKLV